MRDRDSDEICALRIERFLKRSADANPAPHDMASGLLDVRIEQAVAQMEPLTRGILILVVKRKISVSEVARRFRMSEERVCRQFRLAMEMVARRR